MSPHANDVPGVEGGRRTRNRRRRRHRRNDGDGRGGSLAEPPTKSSAEGVVLRPPALLSPCANAGGLLRPRPSEFLTPRRLCTLVLPPLFPGRGGGGGGLPRDAVGGASEAGGTGADPSCSASVVSAATLRTSATAATTAATNTGGGTGGSTAAGSSFSAAAGGGPSLSSATADGGDGPLPPPRVGFAPCDPLLAFGRMVLVATSDGRVCAYEVQRFDEAVNEDLNRAKGAGEDDGERIDEEEDDDDDWEETLRMRRRMRRAARTMDAVPPFAVVGPFRVGRPGAATGGVGDGVGVGDGELDDFAFIVAMCAAPAGTPLLRYRYRHNQRRRPNPAGGDEHPSPKAGPKPSFLGHAAVLTTEGDVHVLEFSEGGDEPSASCEGRESASSAPLEMRVVATLSTGEAGATCFCMRNAHTDLLPRLCIGHESGNLVEYELVSVVTSAVSETESKVVDGGRIKQISSVSGTPTAAAMCGLPIARTPAPSTPDRKEEKGSVDKVKDTMDVTTPSSTTMPLKSSDGSRSSSRKTSANRSPSFDALDKIAALIVKRQSMTAARSGNDGDDSDSTSSSSSLCSSSGNDGIVVTTEMDGKTIEVNEKAAAAGAPNARPKDATPVLPPTSPERRGAAPSSPQRSVSGVAGSVDLSTAATPRRAGSGGGTFTSSLRRNDGKDGGFAKNSAVNATETAVSVTRVSKATDAGEGGAILSSPDGINQFQSTSSPLKTKKTAGKALPSNAAADSSPTQPLVSSPDRPPLASSATSPLTTTTAGSSGAASESPPSRTPMPKTTPTLTLRYSDPRPRLLWRGSFDCPIRAVSALGGGISASVVDGEGRGERQLTTVNRGSKDKDNRQAGEGEWDGDVAVPDATESSTRGDGEEWELWRSFLAVGLAQRSAVGGIDGGTSGAPPLASSTLEVIRASLAEEEWAGTMRRRAEEREEAEDQGAPPPCHDSTRDGVGVTVALDEYCVWPSAGMEIRQAWTWSKSGGSATVGGNEIRGGVRGGDVVSTEQLCSFAGAGDSAFVAVMSDGTMVGLHSFATGSDSNGLGWGVTHDLNQAVLPEGGLCAGISTVECPRFRLHPSEDNNETRGKRAIAYCARDGTVYFVPLVPLLRRGDSIQKSTKVAVFKCPEDRHGTDDGLPVHYLQGFAAGYVLTSSWSEDHINITVGSKGSSQPGKGVIGGIAAQPVFVQAWAGGVLDIYACGPSCLCSNFCCPSNRRESMWCNCSLGSL